MYVPGPYARSRWNRSASSEALTKYFNKAVKKGTAIPLIGFDERLNRRESILQQIESLETEKRQIEQEVRCYLAGKRNRI